MRGRILLFFLLFWAVPLTVGAAVDFYYEKAVYVEHFGISFYPVYPPTVGQSITIRLRTFSPAQKVTIYTDRELEIPLVWRQGHWWGKFKIPDDYQAGGHYFTVWIRELRMDRNGFHPHWSRSVVWYQMIKEKPSAVEQTPLEFEEEIEEKNLIVTGEGITLVRPTSDETNLIIKGSQSIAVRSRQFEGTREGYVSGTQQTREETLRVSITGQAAGTDIEAALFRSSAIGSDTIADRDEKTSIKLRHGRTEAYLGDFTADFTDTEFARLDKVLSGARLDGNYGHWGFKALFSSPKGYARYYRSYGADTQGPYLLESAPVVIDSERVYVDGVKQRRGEDFNIDYQTGSINFIKRVIDRKSILQVYYDYRQNIYQHATTGLRGYLRPIANLTLGLTYLDDADSLTGAAAIRETMTGEAVNPQSHYIIGSDLNLNSQILAAQGEIAYSGQKTNLLDTAPPIADLATKLDVSGDLGPFSLTGRLKKVGLNFSKIAEADPRQDVWEYSSILGFRPGALLGLKSEQAYQRYLQDGVYYENQNRAFQVLLTPERWPSLDYHFSEEDESNDPVSGDYFKRTITRNSAELMHQVGLIATNMKGSTERWLRQYPSTEATDYRKLNFGLATIGLEKISGAANIELEGRDEPTGATPQRQTYNLALSANPNQHYFLASSLQIVDDSAQGKTTVTDLSFRAEPTTGAKLEGRYNMATMDEEFTVTDEAVTKNTGSITLDLRPKSGLRLRYLYKPNFTTIARTGTQSYNNEQNQLEINLLPFSYTMLGLLYKSANSFTIDKNDYPNYRLKQATGQNSSTLYTLKLAPIQILSIELNHYQENSYNTTLTSTSEPPVYLPGQDVTRQIDLVAKTSISETFSFDTRYTFTKTDQGSGEATANLTDTKSHTASLKGLWNYNERWTFSLSTAYTRTTDYLLENIIYTLSPGCGFIYRWADRLRIDGDYLFSQSLAGSLSSKHNLSLKTKYSVNDFVNLIVRYQREIGLSPDYRLTDMSANIEINL